MSASQRYATTSKLHAAPEVTTPTTSDTSAVRATTAASLIESLARRLVLQRLKQLRYGELRIIDGPEALRFGSSTSDPSLRVTVEVLSQQFYVEVAFGGTVGVGGAYIDGHWRCDQLTDLVRLFVLNRDAMNGLDRRWATLRAPLMRAVHWMNRNTRSGSARNIAAHYDLGNDLYQLMLDETMAYSCGIFTAPHSTLTEASRAKFDAVCRKLDLRPGDHLLEIGTGWGGMAVHAAQHYGCRVTTTTISREQYAYTRALVDKLGLRDHVTLLQEDYRTLDGQYDKLVSIEMIEAVGARFLDTYLAKCASLLKGSGAMLLQAITIQDQFYRQALRSVDYIQRYVFPGSFIPSVSAITDSVRRVTDFKLFHLEDIGPHYVRTLATWRKNFFDHISEVRRLGYSDHFVRMWEFYLSYCEGGFAERALGDVQMLLTKPGSRRAAVLSAA
jgi:cyclopropane-fatty-acyl-phospholipid synthase